MKNTLKFIGSLTLGFLILTMSANSAFARINIQPRGEESDVTGTIVALNATTHVIKLDTEGTTPFGITTTDSTVYKDGLTSWNDLTVGARINIEGYRSAGSVYAGRIRPITSTYSSGTKITIYKATIVRKYSDYFIASVAGKNTTFYIDAFTYFAGKDYNSLKKGDAVSVDGRVREDNFLANNVVYLQ